MSAKLDLAFVLIARFDSLHRLENTLAVSEYLVENFSANVYVHEFDTHSNDIFNRLKNDNVKYNFHIDQDPVLHRTAHINQVVGSVHEKYVAIWDVDVIAPPEQVIKSIDLLDNGADFVYPYEHYFYDTSEELRCLYLENRDIGFLMEYSAFMNELYAPTPVGGAFLAKRESFTKVGKENESFYGWGVEDGERFYRWKRMNMIVQRVEGPLFHLSHPRGLNSTITTIDDSIVKNRIRLESIRGTKWTKL